MILTMLSNTNEIVLKIYRLHFVFLVINTLLFFVLCISIRDRFAS